MGPDHWYVYLQGSVRDQTWFEQGHQDRQYFYYRVLKVTNNSPNGQKINSAKVDIGSSVLPDLVFDPKGSADDNVGKCFTTDGGTAGTVGLVAPADPCSSPFSEPHEGGYRVLTLSFTDFNPGETFTFSLDGDHTSINGATDPGPNTSGAVSLELMGSKVTVEFDDGISHTAETFRTPNSPHSSQNSLKSDTLPKPSISVVGVSAPAKVTEPEQTVRVSGPADSEVSLLVLEGGLFTEGVPNGGHDLDPYEANSALTVAEKSEQIGSGGSVDIPVTLTQSDPAGGLNHLVAVIKDSTGRSSPNSDALVLQLENDTEAPDEPTVDLAAASDSGASDADNVTNDAKPTFEGTAEAGSNVRILDGSALVGETTAGGAGTYSFPIPNSKALADGEHQIAARAIDAAGNTSLKSEALTVTIDTQAPETTIDSGPSGTVNDSSATFGFFAEANASFECKLDDQDYANCPSPKSYADLADGEHTFSVRATDEAGNTEATPANRTFTIDTAETTAPTVSVTPTDGESGIRRRHNVKATFSEAMDPKTLVATPTDPANPNVGISTTFQLFKGGATSTELVPAKVTVSEDGTTATLNPSVRLGKRKVYTARIVGAKDLTGNALPDKIWSFKTGRR